MGRASAILRYLADVKSILIGLAIFNFMTFWTISDAILPLCTIPPWYRSWSYLIQPTILLIASFLLKANRSWSNILAFLISGFMTAHIVLIVPDPGETLRDGWQVSP